MSDPENTPVAEEQTPGKEAQVQQAEVAEQATTAPATEETATAESETQATAEAKTETNQPAEAEKAEVATEKNETSAEVASGKQAPAETATAEATEEASEEAPAEPAPKTQRELLAEELQNLTAQANPVNLLFHAPNMEEILEQARAERAAEREAQEAERRARRLAEITQDEDDITSKRRRRRRRGDSDVEFEGGVDGDPENTVTKVRTQRLSDSHTTNRVTGVRGSTRLEAKKQRRRESRATGRHRSGITEAEFLARREAVDRQMIVRQKDDRIQIGVLEDGVLAEHFVSKTQQDSLIGNVYLGKVQNVLPSMEAAFVDIGRGRNAVLYAGEVNWDISGLEGTPRKIENALKPGDSVLVQVTKDPVGHKGARLTSQISLPGRFLVYVPGGSMTGISRKLPDNERARLKKILKDKLPDGAGVIVRTAAEGASEEELTHDINRLRAQWEEIKELSEAPKTLAPEMLYQEPDLTIKTVRDVFNEDFTSMIVQGDDAWDSIEAYVTYMAPDLVSRLSKWDGEVDLFDHYRIEEQLQKALDRKVYLPSGGSLVIDRTEAMTVVDVNTGKFTGSGGNLEETVTKNNLEAAEEIVRQLRLRDIGGIIVIDFIDMVLESNRDLVLRRLVECLGRDRTKHQVAEVTSLGLVQMTRKRMGTGLLEVFSEPCEHCLGRGILVHDQPLKGRSGGASDYIHRHDRDDRKKFRKSQRARDTRSLTLDPEEEAKTETRRAAFASIAAASTHTHEEDAEEPTESKNARKRKRRKRNRREAAAQEAIAHQQNTSAENVVTIGGEVIELPHGESNEDDNTKGEQGSFTLKSLIEVFDAREHKKPQRDSHEDVAAEKLVENSDASLDVDPEIDSRFTQNSERFEAIRAGEARARASQKAGRQFDSRDDNNGEQSDGDSKGGRRCRPRRASSDDASTEPSEKNEKKSDKQGKKQNEGNKKSSKSRVESSEAPKVTGVAQPGSIDGSAGAPEEKSSAVVDAPAAARKPKRKSRRAVSTGVDGSVTATAVTEAKSAGSVVSSSAPAKAESAPAEAPVMLGVGVVAADIKREGK